MDGTKSVGYAMTSAASRPINRHPELASNDQQEGAATLAGLANSLNGQLVEALERTDRMLERIVGPEPGELCKPDNPPAGLIGIFADASRNAGRLLARLNDLECRIGG